MLLLLERLGYRPDVVNNGAEALGALAGKDYDLVFMDVHMPELDGLEASRRIRKRHEPRAPRIIGLTATALPEDLEQCLAAGMEEVITKPFQFSSLIATLERAGAARFAAPPPPPSIDKAALAPLSQPAPPPSPIDEAALTQLSQLVDGDPRELAALLTAYLQTARQLVDQLTAAALADDLAVVAQAVHSLKGNTGMFGALGLLQRCRALEQALRQSEPAAIREAAAAVGREYEAVSGALQHKCAALLQPPAPPA